jgi:hypothetical protein
MKFFLCLCCGRTFLEATDYKGKCVLTGCDGTTTNLMTWEAARKSCPEFPVTPVPRVSYPQNGRPIHATIH